MKALQLVSDGSFWQQWRLDDLNPFHIVDEEIETGFAATALDPTGEPRAPPRRARFRVDDCAAESWIDDEDDPASRRLRRKATMVGIDAERDQRARSSEG